MVEASHLLTSNVELGTVESVLLSAVLFYISIIGLTGFIFRN